jgi:hypothetical protein
VTGLVSTGAWPLVAPASARLAMACWMATLAAPRSAAVAQPRAFPGPTARPNPPPGHHPRAGRPRLGQRRPGRRRHGLLFAAGLNHQPGGMCGALNPLAVLAKLASLQGVPVACSKKGPESLP